MVRKGISLSIKLRHCLQEIFCSVVQNKDQETGKSGDPERKKPPFRPWPAPHGRRESNIGPRPYILVVQEIVGIGPFFSWQECPLFMLDFLNTNNQWLSYWPPFLESSFLYLVEWSLSFVFAKLHKFGPDRLATNWESCKSFLALVAKLRIFKSKCAPEMLLI